MTGAQSVFFCPHQPFFLLDMNMQLFDVPGRILTTLLLLALLAFPGASHAQTSADGYPGARLGFGAVLEFAGDELLVSSAPVDWPAGADPAGEVYRYRQQPGGTWQETGRLGAPDSEHGDEFGRSILASDGWLYVGAPAKSAVYVFQQAVDFGGGTTWSYGHTLTAGDLPDGFELGGAYARGGFRTQTLAKSGDTVFVTSYNGDTSEGAIHMAESGQGMLSTLVQAPAWAITATETTLFAGAPTMNDNTGAVMVFGRASDGSWRQTATLAAPDGSGGALFGRALAADGNRLFVGAPGMDGQGVVYVYEATQGGDWEQIHAFRQADSGSDGAASPAPMFGQGLDVSNMHLAVAARGAAFIVDLDVMDRAPVRLEAPEDQRGRNFGVGIAIHGTSLAVGAPSADYGAGRAILYERQRDGSWAEMSDATSDVVRFKSVTGGRVDCNEGEVNGLYPCDNVDLVSMVSTDVLAHDRGANLNDIWGWEDPETGREYVIAGRTDGTSFIDISDPENPVVVGQLMRTPGSPGSWWRDIKVYRDHAYIVADGAEDHGMQVLDLRQLRDLDPADMPVDFEPTYVYRELASAHNLIVNEESGYLYATGVRAGGESCGGQLHMMDLSDPAKPTFVGCFTHPDFGGTHDAQCVMYKGPDTDYSGREICFNSNGNALIIADVTDKSAPVTIAVAEYPNTAYAHQGWLTEDQRWFYMNDELDEMNKIVDRTRTLIWDMSDLDEPILADEFYHDNGASDHNLYVKGNFMYQSNYHAGLRVFDVSNPLEPVRVGYFDTAPYADNIYGFGGSWSNYPFFKSGIIAVSSQAEGVFLLRKREVDL